MSAGPMRRAVAVLNTLAAIAVATSCTSQAPGTPTPRTSSNSATAGSERATTTTSTASSVPAADPCALLSQAELTQLGHAGQGSRDTISGALTCVWSKPEASLEVRVSPRGVNELNLGSATKVEPTTIGEHTGVRVEELNGVAGDCSFSLAVTTQSSATVGVFMAGKTAQACAQAEQAARLVEPKLPRG